MEEGCSAPTDPVTVVKAFRSLASTLDVYEDGGSDSTGLDIEAIARRKDALGNLAAMLSQALSSCSDMSAGEQLPVSEWSCCQTASIATRITKLADSASEPNVGRPTCTGGARTLWWMVNGMHRQLRIAQYRPAIHEVQAQLSMRRCLQLPDASADGGLGTGLGNGTGSAQTSTGVHAVSDAGTMVLHGHDSGGLILCTIPSFGQQCGSAGDDHAQQDGSTPLSDLPSRSLSLTAHPELPVYASQDCNILARACTQVAPEDPPLSAATAVPPGHPQTTADAAGHPAPAPPEQPTPVAAPPTAHHPAPSTQAAPLTSQPAPMDMDGDDVAAHECMMHMQHASTAATCRVSLSGGVSVDVVCGGGCFEFSRNSPGTVHAPTDPNTEDATLQETARGDTCAEVDGKAAAAARSADVPASERLPAVLCWVVPAATACAADAAGSQHAVCALVDTGGGPQGTVTAVDVMAAGTGDVIAAFTTSAGRLVLWRLSFGPADSGAAAHASTHGAAAVKAPQFACHCCEVLATVDALPEGATVAHHAWPLPQAHAMHAVCWVAGDGQLHVSLSAVVARPPAAERASSRLSGYRVHTVPCGDIGAVSAAAAGHGYVAVGSAAGAVAAWCCDAGNVEPTRVGGWGLDGQAVSALALAVEAAGLQLLVAMESGDVYNFDTGL